MKAFPFYYVDGKYVHGCKPEDATHVVINCPGPLPHRIIPVQIKGTRAGTGNWTWNGSVDKPTLKPSIITKGVRHLTDEEFERVNKGEEVARVDVICHSWVNDGKMIFLKDCTHELAGQTLDLLDVDEHLWIGDDNE